MLLNGKTIANVEQADLQLLVDEERFEDLRLDFKRDCYDFTDNDSKTNKRKEFCKDVAALANASGGWIICGMAEVQGKASSVLGIENLNVDIRKRDFVTWMDNDIEPKLYGVVIEPVRLANGNTVLLIEVPRSFAGPHGVKFKETPNVSNNDQNIYQFPLRRDGKTTFMNTNDLRRAFVGNASYTEQIRDFRRKRVEAILDAKNPDCLTALEDGPLIAVHVLPLSMADQPSRLSFTSFDFAQKPLSIHRDFAQFISRRQFNLLGFLMPQIDDPPKAKSYFQLFRNGVVEYVRTFPFIQEYPVSLHSIETHILAGMAYCVRLLKGAGINEPCYTSISIARTKGKRWNFWGNPEETMLGSSPRLLSYDPLFLPEQYIDEWQQNIELQFKPSLDILANTLGWNKSGSYKEDGSWTKKNMDEAIPSTSI